MKLLIDLDIIARRAACSADSKSGGDQGLERACYNAKSMMTSIFMEMETCEHVGYLGTRGDRTQHRYKIYPQYKENRKRIEYPKYLEGVRSYLISEFNVEVVIGIEADDALSIEQLRNIVIGYNPDTGYRALKDSHTCIVTIDKDLRIVPGWHYNFIKKTLDFQTEIEGLKCFYKQIITGDVSDGVPRVYPNVIVTKYLKKIDLCTNEKEMFDIVYDCYYTIFQEKKVFGQGTYKGSDQEDRDEVLHEIEWRGQLLMPLKKLDEIWEIPKCF